MRDSDLSAIVGKMSEALASAFATGSLTHSQALEVEKLGLIDIWQIPPDRWCPAMTPLGREVFNYINDLFDKALAKDRLPNEDGTS